MLKKAGVDAAPVTYVAADFLKEDWLEKLIAAGFRPDKQSFFLWESVTMYLDRKSVESMLRKIAGTAAGSTVAFDYFSSEIIESPSLFMRYARECDWRTVEVWSRQYPAGEGTGGLLSQGVRPFIGRTIQYWFGDTGKARSGGLRDRGRAVCSDSRERPECPELVESQTRLSGQVPPQKNKRESAEIRSPTIYSFARDRRCSHLP